MNIHLLLTKIGFAPVLTKIYRYCRFKDNYLTFLNFSKKHQKKGQLNDYPTKKINYQNRYRLHDAILTQLGSTPFYYYEFGVGNGESIKYWASKNETKDSRFIGFDSFEGLPSEWEGKKKGHFTQGGMPQTIPDTRVRFVKGWFQDSVYEALTKSDFDKICIFHLDADLFSSTLYVLFQIHPKLKTGDILIFDEFSSIEHEFKALEIFKKCIHDKWHFELIGAVNNYRQVAFQLT